ATRTSRIPGFMRRSPPACAKRCLPSWSAIPRLSGSRSMPAVTPAFSFAALSERWFLIFRPLGLDENGGGGTHRGRTFPCHTDFGDESAAGEIRTARLRIRGGRMSQGGIRCPTAKEVAIRTARACIRYAGVELNEK